VGHDDTGSEPPIRTTSQPLGSLVEHANHTTADHWGLEMKDALDVATDDPDLAGEIALLAELMVAVAHAHVALDQAAIDAILHPPRRPGTHGIHVSGQTRLHVGDQRVGDELAERHGRGSVTRGQEGGVDGRAPGGHLHQ
jgi:hypothetical protein